MKNLKSLAIIILMITTIIILSTKVEATTGTINSETVRVRSEANTKSNIVAQLDKDQKVEILEQSEGWYKVSFSEKGEKVTGYISESLIDLEKGKVEKQEENTTPEPKQEETEQPQQVEENIEEEEPRTDEVSTIIEENKEYKINQAIKVKALPNMSSLEKAEISGGNIKTVEIINDWCRIESDSEMGWIRKNILKKSIENSDSTTEEPETNNDSTETTTNETETNTNTTTEEKPENTTVTKKAYVSTDSLKVRKESNTSSEIIDSLTKNDEVSIIEEKDGWYKIKIDGKIGYVSSKYISDTKVAETTSRGTSSQRTGEVSEIQPEATSETTTTSSSTKGEEVVQYAKTYLGYKYVSGGSLPSTGFDCSGFTTYVFKHFGVSLNRSSRNQIKNGTAVEKSNLKKGDLIIFNGESNKTIGHVGIYIGGGEFIHASNPKGGVKITALDSSYYGSRYVGARRVID